MNRGISAAYQRHVAVAAAMAAPAMVYGAAVPWQGLIPLAGICLTASMAVQRFGAEVSDSLIGCLWQTVGVVLILLSQGESIGTMVGGDSPVPLILLVLLAIAAGERGMESAGKVAGILIWIMGGLLVLTVGSGFREIRWPRLGAKLPVPDMHVVPLLLLPALYGKGTGKRWSICPAVAVVGISVFAWGLLGAAAAEDGAVPFLEAAVQCSLSRSLSRLEGAAYFLGVLAGFSLYAGMFGIIRDSVEEVLPGKGKPAVWASGVTIIGAILCDVYVSPVVAAFLTTINWVVLPLLLQDIRRRKTLRKKGKKT